MKRQVIPELLDDDLGTPAEIASALVDLRHINQWFGGIRTTTKLLRQVASRSAQPQLSLLEVGSGAGDVPLAARRALARQDVELRITLLDRKASHLITNGVHALCADALRLPFKEGAFDVVSSSLFAHHLEHAELRTFVSEALRVCRQAVLINDLIRSPIHLALVYAGLPLFRSRLTWHDSVASVRRAYTPEEIRQILSNVGARELNISRYYLYRMGVLMWKS